LIRRWKDGYSGLRDNRYQLDWHGAELVLCVVSVQALHPRVLLLSSSSSSSCDRIKADWFFKPFGMQRVAKVFFLALRGSSLYGYCIVFILGSFSSFATSDPYCFILPVGMEPICS